MVRASRRAGVPVFMRPVSNPDGPETLRNAVRSGVPRPAALRRARLPQCITPPRNVPEVSMTFRQENSTPMRVRTPRMASFPAADGAFRSVGFESASDSAAEEIVPGAEFNDVVVSSGRLSDGAAFVSGAGRTAVRSRRPARYRGSQVFSSVRRHSSEKRDFVALRPGAPHCRTLRTG